MTADNACRGRWAVTTILTLGFVAACAPHVDAAPAAGLAPLLAQGAAGVVAPGGMEQMAKPARPAMGDAAAGGKPAAAANQPQSAATKTGLLKYAPSYVLLVLCIGLGLFIICRPMSRRNDDDD